MIPVKHWEQSIKEKTWTVWGCCCFAFYPNKQMTTGEGGIIVTNNPEVAKLARSLRNQGRGDGRMAKS